MKNASIIALLLSMVFLSCGDRQQNSDLHLANTSPAVKHRDTNDFFSREVFDWFLITPDRVPIYVLEAGKGEKIVVLHGGFGMEHSYMRSFLKPFEKEYHLVYYDQRGSTRSPVPDYDFDQYITMENMVNDLDLLRAELGEEKITLLAHSMGAVLAYEYMRKYPERVGNVIIISGFVPKFPVTTAAFNDMFLSQKERAEFQNRPEVNQELARLKTTLDTTSSAYRYLNWKVQSAACQIYNFENWPKVEGGPGFFNGEINKRIGPESNIPWMYALKFYWNQRAFNNGTLEISDENSEDQSPVDYTPEIRKHPYRISYLLGRYEVGDFNLRLYTRYLSGIENVDLHIFENACHNIWMDQPEAFSETLGACLAKATNRAISFKGNQ